MTQPIASALSAQHLSLQYGGVTVLNDVSLELPPGAVVGLIGRNGAGKSTLMRCMLGLSVPQSGNVTVLGDPAIALADATRERIGYVPQLPDLVEWMSVWQHIAYIGSFYPKWLEQRARDLCARFELATDLKIKNLSVGDKQKVSIVLALAHDPELVLMDEPVASLDPKMRRDFMRALFDTEKPRTVLLSSHLLSDLQRVVSHVAFLRDGRLQLMGGWDELSENLRIVSVPAALPAWAGLLSQRYDGESWRAIVDLREPGFQHLAESGTPVKLDDLFVELNT